MVNGRMNPEPSKEYSIERKDRSIPIKSILISQPKPQNENSHYFKLANKYNIKVDFRPFIEIEPVTGKDFRQQKVNFLWQTAVIFTSRNAVTHFFRLCKEAKVEMPADMKYFCVSEQTANFLQKFITVRKRKVFTGERTANDLLEIVKKHKKEKFLFPCSDIRRNEIPDFFKKGGYDFKELTIYKTISSDLSDLKDIEYDLIAFFSPSGIQSLFDNFPKFKQKKTRIAAFGPTTAKAVSAHKLFLDIQAPMPNAPSMTGAIEMYIKEAIKLK